MACQLWGIINVTPDSFSDGGECFDPAAAVQRGLQLASEGASVIDVGGESTRPAGAFYGAGAEPVSEAEELRRVIPVIAALRQQLTAAISIDTTKAAVAAAAIGAGATIVNDVSFARSRELVDVAMRGNAELVVMHHRPASTRAEPELAGDRYVETVRQELLAAVERVCGWGMSPHRLWIDPGLGFAKSPQDSLNLLANVDRLVDTGLRVLIGASRKAWIAATAAAVDGNIPPTSARAPGSLAAALYANRCEVAALRVHEVAATRQALLVQTALFDAQRTKNRPGRP